MKKLVTLMLALAMIISAVGVLAEADGKITIWTWDPTFNIKAMQIAKEMYLKDHPDAVIDIQEKLSEDIETAVIASNGWRMPVASRAAALLSEQGAAALLARELPAVRYHLRTPPFWDGLPGSYLQAFGMVKWYNSELEAAWRNERKGYMGLGFD